ncbi:MAG: hypothetical protein OHK0029_11890 [Armatimonadaceae bacterium]
MSQSEDSAAESTPRPVKRRAADSRWWLPVAFIASVLVHILLGYGTQKLGFWDTPKPQPGLTRGEALEVAILTPQPVQEKTAPKEISESPDPSAPEPVTTPAPRSTPAPIAVPAPVPVPVERPNPVPAPAPVPVPNPAAPIPQPDVPRVVPKEQPRPVPKPPRTVSPIEPQPTNRTPPPTAPRIATRTQSGGNLADRLPVPLPPGDLAGAADVSTVERSTPRPNTVRLRPAPHRVPEEDASAEAGGGRSGEAPAKPVPLQEDGKRVAAGEGDGSGGAAGAGAGPKVGSGAGNALGIDRGIPFGSKVGLYGGIAAGGGGLGSGPGGAGTVSVGSRPAGGGGGFRASLKRTPVGGSSGGAPIHIVYVLDVSASMDRSRKMNQARDALHQALDELRPEDSFTIVTFGDKAEVLSPTRTASGTNLANGHLAVAAAMPEPGSYTNLADGLELAFRQQNITHVLVLSDGEPTVGQTDPDEILKLTRRWNRQKARIITFALIGRDNEDFGVDLLKRLADQGGGVFRSVDLR